MSKVSITDQIVAELRDGKGDKDRATRLSELSEELKKLSPKALLFNCLIMQEHKDKVVRRFFIDRALEIPRREVDIDDLILSLNHEKTHNHAYTIGLARQMIFLPEISERVATSQLKILRHRDPMAFQQISLSLRPDELASKQKSLLGKLEKLSIPKNDKEISIPRGKYGVDGHDIILKINFKAHLFTYKRFFFPAEINASLAIVVGMAQDPHPHHPYFLPDNEEYGGVIYRPYPEDVLWGLGNVPIFGSN